MQFERVKQLAETTIDPFGTLLELTEQQVTLERETQAMRHSLCRMQTALAQQYDRLEEVVLQKGEALEVLRYRRFKETGMSEEDIRAHFS